MAVKFSTTVKNGMLDALETAIGTSDTSIATGQTITITGFTINAGN